MDVTRGETTVKLQFWDTLDQERQNLLTSSYYSGAEVVIIVFSLTDKKTFENAEIWYSEARRNADDSALIIVVGTKVDEPTRVVTAGDTTAFLARHPNVRYLEVSAKTCKNIDELMDAIVERFLPPRPAIPWWKRIIDIFRPTTERQ